MPGDYWGDSEQGPSPSIQNMVERQVALTKKVVGGVGTKKWLLVGIAIVAIVFFVKKVT